MFQAAVWHHLAEQKEVKVLILEADSRARESALSNYLGGKGYSPMTVSTGAKAREMLATNGAGRSDRGRRGDSMAGFDICAFIKSDERLRHVHVILVTSSAYPSDYAKAHSVGDDLHGQAVQAGKTGPNGKTACSAKAANSGQVSLTHCRAEARTATEMARRRGR